MLKEREQKTFPTVIFGYWHPDKSGMEIRKRISRSPHAGHSLTTIWGGVAGSRDRSVSGMRSSLSIIIYLIFHLIPLKDLR